MFTFSTEFFVFLALKSEQLWTRSQYKLFKIELLNWES